MKFLESGMKLTATSAVVNSIALTGWQYVWVLTSSLDASRQEHMIAFHASAAIASGGAWFILLIARGLSL